MTHAIHRDIKVVARNDGQGGVSWDPIPAAKLKFNNPKIGDYFLVTFHLDDKTSPKKGLVFQQQLGDALWVREESKGCPQTKCAMNGVFEPIYLSSDRRELTVVNLNQVEQKLAFALNVEDSAGASFSYDPIVDNNNGGQPLSEADSLTVPILVGGAVAVLLGAYLWLN